MRRLLSIIETSQMEHFAICATVDSPGGTYWTRTSDPYSVKVML